jgi:hypothetical protein
VSIIDDALESISMITQHPVLSGVFFVASTSGLLSAFPQLGVDGIFYACIASGTTLVIGTTAIKGVKNQIQSTIEGRPTRFDHMLAPGGYRRSREDESLEEYVEQTVVVPTPNRPFQVVDADERPSPSEEVVARKIERIKATETQRQQIDTTTQTILLGKTRRGPVLKSLKELKNILILGLPGQGKSSLACWILSQMIVSFNAQIIILDRHARDNESLSAMLSPFERRFLLPPAYRFEDMQKSIESANDILNDRMEGEDRSRHPIIFVVDEFTDLMKSKRLNGLEDCVEGFNAMGRKYGCFSLCIGQLSNASRTGGTEIRELFATKLLMAMSESQARMVVDKEFAGSVNNLATGEFLFSGEGREDPFVMSFEKKGQNYYRAQASLLKDEKPILPPQREPAPGPITEDFDRPLRVTVPQAAQNSAKIAEFDRYDVTRDDRNDKPEMASQETVSGQNEAVTVVTALPTGWTDEKAQMLPGFYRVFKNLDKCLEALDLSTSQRNRDYAREMLQEKGLR